MKKIHQYHQTRNLVKIFFISKYEKHTVVPPQTLKKITNKKSGKLNPKRNCLKNFIVLIKFNYFSTKSYEI